MIAVVVALLLILGLAVFWISYKKRGHHEVDYRTLFVLGLVWIPLGLASDNPAFWIIGLVFMAVGLANKSKWKKQKNWDELTTEQQRLKKILMIITSVLLVVGLAAYFYFGYYEKSFNQDEPIVEEEKSEQEVYIDWLEYINQNDYICEGGLIDGRMVFGNMLDQYQAENGTINIILCNAAAYQNNYVAIYEYQDADGKDLISVISFKEYIAADLSGFYDNATPVGLDYDETTGLFSTYAKGRGIGDCGSAGVYQWDDVSREAVLVEYALKEECDEQFDEWPVVYPN